jgi:hypothetical protein
MGKKIEASKTGKSIADSVWLSTAFGYLAYAAKLPAIIGKILWPVGMGLELIELVRIINKIGSDITTWDLLRKNRKKNEILPEISPTDARYQFLIKVKEDETRFTGWRNVVNAIVNTLTLAGKLGALAGCTLLAMAAFGSGVAISWLIPACFIVALGTASISNVMRALEENKLLENKTLDSKEYKDSKTKKNTFIDTSFLCAVACAAVFGALFAPAIPALAAIATTPVMTLLVGAVAAINMAITTIASKIIISNHKADEAETALVSGTSAHAALDSAGVDATLGDDEESVVVQTAAAPPRNPLTRLFRSCLPDAAPTADDAAASHAPFLNTYYDPV